MTTTDSPDLLYGYEEIGKHLGLNARQVEHLVEQDDSDFPSFKIGRRVCALRSRLNSWLLDQADKSVQAKVEGRGK